MSGAPKQPGQEILHRLLETTDVVVENDRPETMEKLGFGWEKLRKINPRLIYASISGFGHDTPPEYGTRPSCDTVALHETASNRASLLPVE